MLNQTPLVHYHPVVVVFCKTRVKLRSFIAIVWKVFNKTIFFSLALVGYEIANSVLRA